MNANVLNGHGLYKYINLTTVLILIQIVVVKRTYKLYFVCVCGCGGVFVRKPMK